MVFVTTGFFTVVGVWVVIGFLLPDLHFFIHLIVTIIISLSLAIWIGEEIGISDWIEYDL